MKSSRIQSYSADRASVLGKEPPILDETDLLIVGAGVAGLAAALLAAGKGVRVTLVDENPVPLKTMGEDIPLHFGGRMGSILSNHNAALESLLEANPKLGDAIDAGIDVRLGTVVWGLFPNRPTAAWIDGQVAGLADLEQAYLLRFKQVIVASGCRDMGLAFEGWERAGVMGAAAAYRLANNYEALDAKVAVLVGSNSAALQIGNALADRGVHIAAIIEQSGTVLGAAHLLTPLIQQGARVFTRHVVRRVQGNTFGVIGADLVAIDDAGRHLTRKIDTIECDAVLLGIGAIPSIELIEATGCEVQFQADRGGHVAVIDEAQRTSLPFILVAGDCAGTWSSKSMSEVIAVREGRVAAATALQALGVKAPDVPAAVMRPDAIHENRLVLDRMGWVRASVLESASQPYVCQCEEVTAAEILALRPPRYLGSKGDADHQVSRAVGSLDATMAPNPDAIKRLTRAGMGACQGRRCREQVAALIALGSKTVLSDIPLATYRPPVRPLALHLLAKLQESPAMNEHWDGWFGMARQWVPFWRAEFTYTAASQRDAGPVASE